MSEHMSKKQKSKREEIVKGMKKGDGKEFEKRYPGRGKEVMYATATKQAMKEDIISFYKQKLLENIIQENEQSSQPPHPLAAEINSLELSPEQQEEAHNIIRAFQSTYTYEQPSVLNALHNHLLRSGLPKDHPFVKKVKGEMREIEQLNAEKDQARAGEADIRDDLDRRASRRGW